KHYPGDSRVAFEAAPTAQECQTLQRSLASVLPELLAENNPVRIVTTSEMSRIATVCGYSPDYLPPEEPVRLVIVHANLGRPCMGTHVERIGAIGSIEITALKCKKGKLSVSYKVSEGTVETAIK